MLLRFQVYRKLSSSPRFLIWNSFCYMTIHWVIWISLHKDMRVTNEVMKRRVKFSHTTRFGYAFFRHSRCFMNIYLIFSFQCVIFSSIIHFVLKWVLLFRPRLIQIQIQRISYSKQYGAFLIAVSYTSCEDITAPVARQLFFSALIRPAFWKHSNTTRRIVMQMIWSYRNLKINFPRKATEFDLCCF